MKFHILFSRTNKKTILKCHLLKFLPSIQSVKTQHMYSILSLKTWSEIGSGHFYTSGICVNVVLVLSGSV